MPALPPGPPGALPLGVLRRVRRDPLATARDLFSEHGDLVLVRVLGKHLYLANHPDHVKTLLVDHAEDLGRGAMIRAIRRVLGHGLMTAPREEHRRQRRLLAPHFQRGRIDGYAEGIVACALRGRDRFADGQTVDVVHAMGTLSIEIVCRLLFGVDLDDQAPALRHAVEDLLANLPAVVTAAWLGGLARGAPVHAIRRGHAALRTLDAFIDELVAARRGAANPEHDVLDVILAHEDDPERARDQVLTFLLNGHDTITHTLAWTWHLLSRHPEVQEALHADIDAVCGEDPPDAAAAAALPLADAIFSEGMRLSPPGWAFNRRVERPFALGGYEVPAGAVAFVFPHLLHRDPRFWEDPDAFDPGRWSEARSATRPKYAYLPFSWGPRSCIAAHLARLEAALVLATLGQRWRVRPVPGFEPRLRPSFTMQIDGGLPLVLERR